MSKPIGETLKEGRLRQRLSVAECAKRTHVASRYIEALEEERWDDLPSESHRIGFLKLYARFLGVYSDEMMQTYQQAKHPTGAEPNANPNSPMDNLKPSASPKPKLIVDKSIRPPSRWNQLTPQRISLVLIFGFVATWGLYHGLRSSSPERHMDLSWLKFKPRAPRLTGTKQVAQVQRVRAKADGDTWMRVTDNQQLMFEGILPGGAEKEWSGPGPFSVKIGNIGAISIFWNEQPVDLKAAARGSVAELRLPPS